MASPPDRYAGCEELFAVLSEYLDANLPPTDCAAIEAHIASCPACVEFVESLKRSVKLCRVSGAPPDLPPLPDDVRKKLFDAYQKSLAAGRD